MKNKIFVSCPKSFEDLLKIEMEAQGLQEIKLAPAGASGLATLEQCYRLCLWSRIANRVLWYLLERSEIEIDGDYELYSEAYSVPWEEHLDPSRSIAVDFTGQNRAINNTQFGAMRIKDAIVDRLNEKLGFRPNVDKQNPDMRIHARLHKDRLSLALDLSGESLHRRGYRRYQGEAPLKENLAAGLLLRAGWLELAKANKPLWDPMCGSGTFLCEAGLMAIDMAPGLFRDSFGFESWLHHDEGLFRRVKDEVTAACESSKHRFEGRLFGADSDAKMIDLAEKNLAKAGLLHMASLRCEAIEQMTRPCEQSGLMVSNPPYGERLGERENLKHLYKTLAEKAKEHAAGWQLALLSSDSGLLSELRLRAKRKNKVMNGALESEFHCFDLMSNTQATLRDDARPSESESLSEGAKMVENRLKKNANRLQKWLAGAQTNCYRVYDADMPEYAAAVDIYGDEVHVQEYAPPKKIDEHAANRRFRELVQAVSSFSQKPVKQIACKVRKQNKGKSQYEKVGQTDKKLEVLEGKAKLWVNLWDYLDTGLFLDHRPLRLRLAKEAITKDFLNLFCYTATATVHAALGGAKSSVSVDMSRTYIDWARENFKLNRISEQRHELVQEDCFKWLKNCRKGFDLIMLDPPTFSNSKRMDDVLDVQRDHTRLITRCMEILKPGGKLYFSNNLRGFKIDEELNEKFSVQDITPSTIDKDFERNAKIHHCFLIEHK